MSHMPEESLSAQPSAKSSSSKMVIIILLVVLLGGCGCVGVPVAVALLLPAVQVAREAARSANCASNLKNIGLALHNYHNDHGTFPPAYIADENGRPMHSWRVLILPYMLEEEQALYAQYDFNEPWDGPHNRMLMDKCPPRYRCPSSDLPEGVTGYLAMTGPGLIFDEDHTTSIRNITDGTSNTIMVVEAADAGVNWLEPTDLDIDNISFTINDPNTGAAIASGHVNKANVLYADGSVHQLAVGIDPQMLYALFTKAGGEVVQVPIDSPSP